MKYVKVPLLASKNYKQKKLILRGKDEIKKMKWVRRKAVVVKVVVAAAVAVVKREVLIAKCLTASINVNLYLFICVFIYFFFFFLTLHSELSEYCIKKLNK